MTSCHSSPLQAKSDHIMSRGGGRGPGPVKQNVFIVFVTERRREVAAANGVNLTLQQAISEFGGEWLKMTQEERAPYRQKAGKDVELTSPISGRMSARFPAYGKNPLDFNYGSFKGEDPEAVQQHFNTWLENNPAQDLENPFMESTGIPDLRVRNWKRYEIHRLCNPVYGNPVKHRFVLIEAVIYSRSPDGLEYIPGEISLSVFSLQEGLLDNFCAMIDPGHPPADSANQFYENRQKYALPAPPYDFECANYANIWSQLESFANLYPTNGTDTTYLFCRERQTKKIQNVLDWLAQKAGEKNPWELHPLGVLLYQLSGYAQQVYLSWLRRQRALHELFAPGAHDQGSTGNLVSKGIAAQKYDTVPPDYEESDTDSIASSDFFHSCNSNSTVIRDQDVWSDEDAYMSSDDEGNTETEEDEESAVYGPSHGRRNPVGRYSVSLSIVGHLSDLEGSDLPEVASVDLESNPRKPPYTIPNYFSRARNLPSTASDDLKGIVERYTRLRMLEKPVPVPAKALEPQIIERASTSAGIQAISPLESPHCHRSEVIPRLEPPHCHRSEAIPRLEPPHCHRSEAIPRLEAPHCCDSQNPTSINYHEIELFPFEQQAEIFFDSMDLASSPELACPHHMVNTDGLTYCPLSTVNRNALNLIDLLCGLLHIQPKEGQHYPCRDPKIERQKRRLEVMYYTHCSFKFLPGFNFSAYMSEIEYETSSQGSSRCSSRTSDSEDSDDCDSLPPN